MGKLLAIPLLLLIVSFIVGTEIFCLAKAKCMNEEQNALLKFKASLIDPSDHRRLSSWKIQTDCCTWEGVSCDITGHVIKLDLGNRNLRLQGRDNNEFHVDSSLSELKNLNHLDLSQNDFRFASVPAFLGSMKELQHLNLSKALFSGPVPHDLGYLSNLRTLDLSCNANLMVGDLTWISNLSSLEHIDLSDVGM